ncbi:amidohydrolase family protein [Janthinobacterium sp. HH01]|uniref:amidohydrolase family protein n=1 Tax=Janthinobacterium sp. HH01 TaxID=1198452 RepID=UPI0012684371|nr:amidohydrolase family protein [Janthinobacterium sp. HH01]
MSETQFACRRRNLVRLVGIGCGAILLPHASRAEINPQDFLPILAPPPAARPTGMPRRAIDVHAHFFNATDIDAISYLQHSIAHEIPGGEVLVGIFKPLLKKIIASARTAAEEIEDLLRLQEQLRSLSPESASIAIDQLAREKRIQTAEFIYTHMLADGTALKLMQNLKLESQQSKLAAPPIASFSRQFIEEAVSVDPAVAAPEPFVEPALAKKLRETYKGLVRFIGCMKNDRWVNLRTFEEGFRGRGIDAVFGAMVNFDGLYNNARSPFADQLKLQALLSRLSKGYLLPLAAYNPQADMDSKGAMLTDVIDALTNQGFIGVKIYPPLGFYPYGNVKLGDKHDKKFMKHALQFDEHMLALFLACGKLGAPVMAHANKSMGRNGAWDNGSKPEGWIALTERLALEQQTPMVNLGHFAGDAAFKDDWQPRFAELMTRNGTSKIYADLANWKRLRACVADSDCESLKRLKATIAGNPGVEKKLMYGSDWFMMIKSSNWQDYAGDLALALRGMDLDALFYNNALDCYNLGPGGMRRAAVEKHLGYVPDWLA